MNASHPPRNPAGRPASTRLLVMICGVVTLVVAALVAAIVVTAMSQRANPTGPVSVIRADTHTLGSVGTENVTLVEFFDFECPPCGAAYPVVEQLRERYEGRVTFAVRYFPLPMHRNATNAALAAEAAAEQGKFGEMYQRIFESQSEWAGATDSRAAVFRSYAQDLGLDMASYDAAVADAATAARVQSDIDEGTALGVSGTPTFFLDGERLELQSAQDLVAAVEAAVGG